MNKKSILQKSLSIFLSVITAVSVLVIPSVSASAAEVTPSGYITVDKEVYDKFPEAVEALAQGIYNMEDQIMLVDYKVPAQYAGALYETALRSHPELFYTDVNYRYGFFTLNGTDYVGVYLPEYLYAKDEILQKRDEFFKVAEQKLSQVNDSMSDFQKAVILHDALALDSVYNLEGLQYDLLVKGQGRCAGYALAYAYLLARVGIKSEFVQSDEMVHDWLKICLDGKYYNVDLTWDDPTVDRPGMVDHAYFLVSDEKLKDTNGDLTPHYGYESAYASDTAYDNKLIHEINTKLCFIGDDCYVIDNISGRKYSKSLLRYDFDTDTAKVLKTFNYVWSAGSYGYWVNSFMSLDEKDGLLYYNSADAVYTYNPKDGKETLFAKNTYGKPFYGMYIKDGKVYAALTNDPRIEREIVCVGDCVEVPTEPATTESTTESTTEPTTEPTTAELTTEPTTEPTTAEITTEPVETKPQYQLGDVNKDGVINVADATQIQRHVAHIMTLDDEALAVADTNHDGQVNIYDATQIQRAVAGIITL